MYGNVNAFLYLPLWAIIEPQHEMYGNLIGYCPHFAQGRIEPQHEMYGNFKKAPTNY